MLTCSVIIQPMRISRSHSNGKFERIRCMDNRQSYFSASFPSPTLRFHTRSRPFDRRPRVLQRQTNTKNTTVLQSTSMIEIKFSIERSWIKSVSRTKNKPNYGMTNMDSLLELVVGNKLEMCGPLIDSYLREIGKAIGSKLSRSKATSLGNPVFLFVPWPVFVHFLTLAGGYSGDTTALSPSPLDFHTEKEL